MPDLRVQLIFKDTLHSGDEGELVTQESWHVPVLLGLAGAFEGLSVQQEGEEGVLPLLLLQLAQTGQGGSGAGVPGEPLQRGAHPKHPMARQGGMLPTASQTKQLQSRAEREGGPS